MQLHFCDIDNFGDQLNTLLWPRLFLNSIEEMGPASALLLGIGTILRGQFPAKEMKFVLGSGAGYGPAPLIDSSWEWLWVRGPRTSAAIGIESKLSITDPAALIGRPKCTPDTTPRPAFVPHHLSAEQFDWQPVCDLINITYIDPRRPPQDVLPMLARASCVVTEAMHGAILADAFRVPWIAIRSRRAINAFKWSDWWASMQVEATFNYLPPLYSHGPRAGFSRIVLQPLLIRRLQWIIRHSKRHLSRDSVLEDRRVRMLDALARHPIFKDHLSEHFNHGTGIELLGN